MTQINSKQKGSKNERSVARLFKDWTGFSFSRTPQSGGLHWQKQNTIGDIVCIDEKHSRKFPFSIECKFHAEVDFSYLIDETSGKKSNKLIGFWLQAKGDADKVNKIPILFVRRNMMRSHTHFVGIPTQLLNLMIIHSEVPINHELGIIQYSKGDYHITFMNSKDFFGIPYNLVYRMALKLKRLNKYGNGKE